MPRLVIYLLTFYMFYQKVNQVKYILEMHLTTYKAPFTTGPRALYNTLQSEFFSLARAFAYVARCLSFVACILVVASSLFKIVDMHTIMTQSNAIQIIAM